MTEYTISKDRYMQTYNYPDHCTVSFYSGARMDTTPVEEFSMYRKDFSCATFYLEVPYAVVEAYLKTVGT
jgi:hypothetical protein